MNLMKTWSQLMVVNMTHDERFVRALVGVACLMVAVLLRQPWAWVGLYPLGTGILGVSPIYRLLGIRRDQML
ncbi:MAG: DUF2892 domain-containing protein [Polyangiaceae bacterium]